MPEMQKADTEGPVIALVPGLSAYDVQSKNHISSLENTLRDTILERSADYPM
jgi:hypothetical protein